MNSIRIALASFLLAVVVTPGLAQAKDSPDEQAIRQTLARYETALNAADTASIVDLYTQDGVQMAPDAPAAVGQEGVKAAYEGTFKAISLKLKFNVDEVKVLSKTSALLRSHSVGTLKVNGVDQPAGPAAFKELFVLRKQANGQWKFSHYSFSTAPVAK
jgi:uncharacterized protein (TIGR02246 family)